MRLSLGINPIIAPDVLLRAGSQVKSRQERKLDSALRPETEGHGHTGMFLVLGLIILAIIFVLMFLPHFMERFWREFLPNSI